MGILNFSRMNSSPTRGRKKSITKSSFRGCSVRRVLVQLPEQEVGGKREKGLFDYGKGCPLDTEVGKGVGV